VENIKPALERTVCKKRKNLWGIGGYNTLNQGLKRARERNFSHYTHIDNDVIWHSSHLYFLAASYYMFEETNVVWTRGARAKPTNLILPIGNFFPDGSDCYHSCFRFRLDQIPLEYTTIDPKIMERREEKPDVLVADYAMIIEIAKLIRQGKELATSVDVITCYRPEEAIRLKE